MSFEETELRLGLPGNNNGRSEMTRKRGLFHEEEYSSPTHQTILTMPDLKLNLISSQSLPPPKYVLNSSSSSSFNLLDS